MKTILAILGLVITVASTTFAVSASSVIKREEQLELRVRAQEIISAQVCTKLDSIKETVDRIDKRTEK